METLRQSLKEVLGSYLPDQLSFWLPLAGGLIAVDFLYRCLKRPRSESFWSYSAPWRIYTHASALLDYKFVLVQQLATLLIIGPLLVSELALGKWGSKILVSWLGPGPNWTAGAASLALFFAIGLVLFDIGHTISHYIQHKVPFFWEFHKIHHAAEVLTPVTNFRTHPVSLVLDSVFQGSLHGVGLALFYYLYGVQKSGVAFVGMSSLIFIFYVIGHLRHTHVWISFGPKLEHIFSSPAQHQIHHSAAPRHLDTNFAQYFAFLDWIAGTLYVPKGQEELDFGLSEGSDPELKTVWSLYWVPMKRAFRVLLPEPSTARSPDPQEYC